MKTFTNVVMGLMVAVMIITLAAAFMLKFLNETELVVNMALAFASTLLVYLSTDKLSDYAEGKNK